MASQLDGKCWQAKALAKPNCSQRKATYQAEGDANLAIDGTRGGDPAGTELPARFEIDDIRVYRATVAATAPD